MEIAPEQVQILGEVLTELQGRGESAKIIHYTDGIKGCGLLLEEKIQASFFNILSRVTRLVEQVSGQESSSLLPLLEWKFSARDFGYLTEKLPIFKILSSSGHQSLSEALCATKFERNKFIIFREVFFTVAARAIESEAVSTIEI